MVNYEPSKIFHILQGHIERVDHLPGADHAQLYYVQSTPEKSNNEHCSSEHQVANIFHVHMRKEGQKD